MSQADELERVSYRIGQQVLAFFRQHTGVFHAEDLRRHIRRTVGEVAPGSPDRIMRALRQAGRIDYKLKSRSESAYEILKGAA